MTKNEEKFLKYLKKKLFLSRITIKTKISISELCAENNSVCFMFGKDEAIIKNVLIDFVLYKGGKAIAGIELIDEPEELEMEKGRSILIDSLFRTMGYELFRVVDLSRLKEAADIIVAKIK